MAGINFNDLPQNLQAKLQPYMSVSGSVENAIETARLNGKWTEADTKQLNALNGGANWGKVMDEYAFDSSKAAEYKANLPKAQKENQLAQARKRNNKEQGSTTLDTAKKIGRYAGAAIAATGAAVGTGILVAGAAATLPAWAPFAVAGAGLMLLTSCDKISQEQDVTINMKDYTTQIEQLIDGLNKMGNQDAQQFKALIEQLQVIIQNQNAQKEATEAQLTAMGFQLNAIYDKIQDWLEQVVNNQIEMKVDNNKNAQDILNALKNIINGNGTVQSKLGDVITLLQQIKSVGESIDKTTKDILEAIKNAKEELKATLNTNNKAVLAAIDKLNENDQTTLDILNDIKALIEKYGNSGNSLAQSILVAIGRINPSVDLSGVEAMLGQLVTGQKQTNAEVTNLTNLFNKFSANTATQLNTIIDKLDKNSPNYEAQLNAIIDLLEQLDANNDTRNKKVLDAIDKLGVDISGDLVAIMNKIGQGGTTAPDYTDILNKILDKIGAIQADNNNNFAKVIEAIGNIDIKPQDLSWIKAHLDEILEAIKDHDVVVTVEGGKCCCCDGNGTIHEGVLGDLNNLLG